MEYFIKKHNISHMLNKNEILNELSLKNLKNNFYYSNFRYFNNINMLWTKIQKNSSSTIFLSLSIENGVNDYLNIANPKEFQNIMSESNKKIEKIKNEYKTLICFRNPKKRLVSLFLDKIVNNSNIDENSIRLLNKINTNYNKIKFYDFLYFIYENKKTLNKLWKDQSSYVLFNYYDYILDTENLERTWIYPKLHKFVHHATSTNIKIDIDIDNMSILDMKEYNNYSISYLNFFRNKEIQKLFNEIYKDDIILYESIFNRKVY